MIFWHGFIPIPTGIDIDILLNRKYLAYLALLAGWIGFCYWLYAKEIFPRFHGTEVTTLPVFIDNLEAPLAFNWGSSVPLAGEGYKEWKANIERLDSVEEIIIIKGYYFRDEKGSIPLDEVLAKKRVESFLNLVDLSKDRILVQVLPQEINADVRSKPFEAIGIERIAMDNLLRLSGDTIEMCFPIKDSLNLPPLLLKSLDIWLSKHADQKNSQSAIVGIADGSGIVESADVAMDRALYMQKELIKNGWMEDHIHLSAGQRSDPLAIRNRCVIIYKE